jgi:hypothetical protein
MTPLRQKMIEDMQLRGLAERTHQAMSQPFGVWRSTQCH